MSKECWVAFLMHIDHNLVLFKKIKVELFGEFLFGLFCIIS